MKNNKIAVKLGLYFTGTLVLFALTIGMIFFFLFKNYMVDVHREDLVHYAQSIAGELAEEQNASSHQRMMSDTSAYLRFIQDVVGDDVWLVDEELNLLATGGNTHGSGRENGNGHGRMRQQEEEVILQSNLSDLPENAQDLIAKVFQGETTFSEGFSTNLNQATLTVGAPITNLEGEIWGAILIHSAVSDTTAAIKKGFNLLALSLISALILALILVSFLAYSFTKPLSKMKTAALRLAQGDYQAQTNVSQKDEIGELSQAIDTLALRLDEASRESEKLEQMRQDFVANISHELRTPITVMRGSLEALTDKIVTEPAKVDDYHQQMLTEAKFLERLVGDLLDLSRLQNIDFQIEKAPLSLQEVLQDTLRSAGQLAQEKEITFDLSLSKAPLIIQGDYGRLRQMLLIVLDNGIKFSPRKSRIRVRLTEDVLEIEDQGPGIPPEQLPYIFDRFHKTYGETNKVGTGLGLAIAKQIADRHNLPLTARNSNNKGAIFAFNFAKVEKFHPETL
ncbi:sensor histidine kinase [Enterococcus sp. LJL98]